MQAIFIVGEQRSGSNLLRLMISQAGIAAPHPPHMLTRLMPLIPSYGDLSSDASWGRLVDDACELVDRNPVPWPSVGTLDREDIKARCRERSLIAIFAAVMDRYAEATGATAWACKSMQYSKFGPALDAYLDKPKYIYLHRDGRDVTLSFTKAVVGEKHPYLIAKKWAAMQAVCIAERERIPERYFTVCYEELTAEPEPVLRGLCTFLDVSFTAEMMSFHRSNEAQATSDKSQLWENLSRPIMRNNSRKFLKGLSEEQIRLVESVAGEALDALGYERVMVQPGEEVVISAEALKEMTAENEKLKKERRALMTEDDAARRSHQLGLLSERVYFMQAFDGAEALKFLHFVREEHIESDMLVTEQGQFERDIFFIIAGEAVVMKDGVKVGTLSPGESFGEIGALGGGERIATVRTVGPMRLFRLSWARLNAMRTDSPALALKVLWAVSARLAERFRGNLL